MSQSFINEFEASVRDSQLDQARQSAEFIDSLFEKTQWQIYQISRNQQLLQYIYSSDAEKQNSVQIQTILDNLRDIHLYSSSNDSSFYIIFKDIDLIFTPFSCYHKSDFIENKTILQIEGISNDYWHSLLFSIYHGGTLFPERHVTIEDFRNKLMIPYIQSLPIRPSGTTDTVKVVLVYFLGSKDFRGILENSGLPEGGYSYLSDQNDQILLSYSNGNQIIQRIDLPDDKKEGILPIRDGEYMVVFSRSEEHNWTYVSVLPRNEVFRRVRQLQFFSLLILFFSLMISFLFASFIAYTRSLSIKQIFNRLSDIFGGEAQPQNYHYLNMGIKKLIDTNTSMKDELKKQSDLVHSNLLNNLLNHYYSSREVLRQYETLLGIGKENNTFTVVSLTLTAAVELDNLERLDELNQVKVVLKAIVYEQYPYKVWIHYPSDEQITIIYQNPSAIDKKRQLKDLTDNLILLQKACITHYPPGLAIGMGNSVQSFSEIYCSFIESREAEIYYLQQFQDLIDAKTYYIHFKDIEKDLDNYYYPLEIERQLINAIKAGDKKTVTFFIEKLWNENFLIRSIPGEIMRFFIYELKSTVTKLITTSQFQLSDFMFKEEGDPEGAFLEVKKVFDSLCEYNKKTKKSHNSDLLSRILDFLNQEYANPGLSLTMVSEKFSISESYLSFFVKEQTGENFSHHLGQIRIKRSKELLCSTQESIQDIALEVGYGSDKSFRRAFKKENGISPSVYRLNLKA